MCEMCMVWLREGVSGLGLGLQSCRNRGVWDVCLGCDGVGGWVAWARKCGVVLCLDHLC